MSTRSRAVSYLPETDDEYHWDEADEPTFEPLDLKAKRPTQHSEGINQRRPALYFYSLQAF